MVNPKVSVNNEEGTSVECTLMEGKDEAVVGGLGELVSW